MIFLCGFFAVFGAMWFLLSPREGQYWTHYKNEFSDDPKVRAGTARVRVTKRAELVSRIFGGSIFALGVSGLAVSLDLLQISVSAAAARTTALTIAGLAACATAAWIWRNHDRIEAARVRQRESEPSAGLAGAFVRDGPGEALSTSFWAALPVRVAAGLLLGIGAFLLIGIVVPDVVEDAFNGYGKISDVIELGGYGAIALAIAIALIAR